MTVFDARRFSWTSIPGGSMATAHGLLWHAFDMGAPGAGTVGWPDWPYWSANRAGGQSIENGNGGWVVVPPPVSFNSESTPAPDGPSFDVGALKRVFPEYSHPTGLEILKVLPRAYAQYQADGGRWGPGLVATHIAIHATTIGRYMKAFRSIGLKEWEGVPLP